MNNTSASGNDENKVKKIVPSKLENAFYPIVYNTFGKIVPSWMTPKQITLMLQLEENEQILGNGDQIVQLVLLLGDNAIKYSPEGSHIRYKTKLLSNGSLEMSVVDNGPGIPEEDLPFIFERFYKVDKSHAHSSSKGTGLGLAIAKEIVRMHGAQIEVFSQVGVGTRFVVTFPAETVVRQDGLP